MCFDQDIDDDYIKSMYGREKIEGIGQSLRGIGLGCEQNSYNNIMGMTKNVLGSFDAGGSFFYAAPGQQKFYADFFIDKKGHAIHHKLQTLFSDRFIEQFAGYMTLHDFKEKNSFKSSTMRGIQRVVTEAGKLLGKLASGNRINAGELGNTLTDMFGELGNMCVNPLKSQSRNLDKKWIGTQFLVEPDEDDPRKPSQIGIMRYEVTLSVSEYMDKKIDEKQCSYDMRQRSLTLHPSHGPLILKAFNEITNN